jgi:galactose-1-phosphate uridylyltransferase
MCSVGDHFWKSSGRLADGREIIYFDESPGLGRASIPDQRPLTGVPAVTAPPGGAGQNLAPAGLRWDALAGEWVIVAAQRQERTFLPPPTECPLDPSGPGRLTEIPAPGYDVVVFENRFPSLRGLPPAAPETGGVPGRPPTGRCEVVCFTADHQASFASLPPRRVRTVLEAWAFCDIYPDLLRRFDALFGLPLPYIAAWHQAPAGDEFACREFALHLQVFSIRRAPGKLKYLAGTESGMGVWINDITPEEAAHELREPR